MDLEADRRLLELLQRILDLPALDVGKALTAAATYVAEWFACDKVDVFLLDPARTTLVALGTSDTPLGKLQKELGLDMLPLANGGRMVDTLKTGTTYHTGRADLDEGELIGIVRSCRTCSNASCRLGPNAASVSGCTWPSAWRRRTAARCASSRS